MKVALIQVSDIHISTEKYTDNAILKRVPQILSAINSLFLSDPEPRGVFLLFTGDIAFAGLEDEYKLAAPFIKSIEDGLKNQFKTSEHHSFYIPGNHDCNFRLDDQARQKLIADPDPTSLNDGSIIAVATSIQDAFFEFCKEMHGNPERAKGFERLYAQHIFEIDGKTIAVNTFNSAWSSRLHESRDLVMPVAYLQDHLSDCPGASLVISLIHHPYNWFEPTNSRVLRGMLERTSDIILTGHEHVSDTYVKTGKIGEQNEYIEGGVLQEHNDPHSSAFNIVVVDLTLNTQQSYSLCWEKDIYEVANEPVVQPFIRNRQRLRNDFQLSDEFETFLNDPEAVYSHPHKDRVTLEDVFVYPDCRELDEDHRKSKSRLIHGRELINHVLKHKKLLITGPERAGKTALAKALFKDLLKNGKVPLFISGKDLNTTFIKKAQQHLDRCFETQYDSPAKSRYWQLDKGARVVVIDDFHKVPPGKNVRDQALDALNQRFDTIIVLAAKVIELQDLMGHDRQSRILWTYNHSEIQGLGHRLRSDFIKKWHLIGRESHSDDDAVTQKTIQLEKVISHILGHDLLPPYPVYLLLLLQQLESQNPHDITAASYARLYGSVLTAYLAKSGGADELETKINYLAELAFHLFQERKDRISEDDAVAWHNDYVSRHLDAIEYGEIKDELVQAQMLQVQHGEVRFKYKASYFYFVAMYLSDHISEPSVRDHVTKLCRKVHREEAANIVIFLCHRSKDPIILNEVLATANSLFVGSPEAKLFSDIKFADNLVGTVQRLAIEDKNPESNRLKSLEEQDIRDEEDDGGDDEPYIHKVDDDSEQDIESEGLDVNAALKSIQIIGQILRSFGGRLSGEDKLRLTRACFSLGLRLLGKYYKIFRENDGVVAEMCKSLIDEGDLSDINAERIAQVVNEIVYQLIKLGTFGVVKHISTAIGLERLAPVFSEVLKKDGSFEHKLIDISIRMDHYQAFPMIQITELWKEVKDSVILKDVIKLLVFNRLYFFAAPPDIKQKVCSLVGIDLKSQPALLSTDYKRNA